MTIAFYLPPQAESQKVPVLWYLSGLTCTHANVMDKGEYRRAAARHGIAIVAPDTSPARAGRAGRARQLAVRLRRRLLRRRHAGAL